MHLTFGLVHENFDNRNTTYIKAVYLHPDYRNKGLGNLLMKTITEREIANDHNMLLHNYLINFYKKWGCN